MGHQAKGDEDVNPHEEFENRNAPGPARHARADLTAHAERRAQVLKAMASAKRLMILCTLAEAERSVSSLAQHLGMRQAAVSQHLARLRLEKLVATRRDGQTIYYRVADGAVADLVDHVCGRRAFDAEGNGG